MTQEQTIALYQPMLMRIAIKIVGSIADAEDIVQDTFLKWLTTNTEKIENTKAYLVRAVTNNCINHLKTLKRKKDECLSNLHANELIDWYREKEFFKFDMENEVSMALNVVHKKLEPVERGIFMLRELFDLEYDELQLIFDKKKENCRQMFSRAKKKLSDDADHFKSNIHNTSFLENIKKSIHIGSPTEFIEELKKEINTKLNK